MGPQEMLEALLEQGIDNEEAERLVRSIRNQPRSEWPTSPEEVVAAAQSYAPQGPAGERAEPETPPGDDSEVIGTTEEGEPITELMLLEGIAQQTSWVNQGNVGVMGALSQEDLLDLYETFDPQSQAQIDGQTGGIAAGILATETDGELDPDVIRAAKVAQYLEQHRGAPTAIYTLQQWAIEKNRWQVPQTINGMDSSLVISFADQAGVSHDRASIALAAAESEGVPLPLFTRAWQLSDRDTKQDHVQVRDTKLPDHLAGDEYSFVPNETYQAPRRNDIEVAKEVKKYVGLYGDTSLLPIIAVHDAELAERLYNGDSSISIGEFNTVLELLGDPNELLREMPWAGAQISHVQEMASGGGIQTVEVPSKESLEESVRTLAKSWNLNLSPSTIAAIAEGAVADVVSSFANQRPNIWRTSDTPAQGTRIVERPSPQQSIEESLRGTGDYNRLFRHLGPGESEEEYAGRFASASAQQLGEQNPEAIRAGMAAGDERSVVGQAVASGEAFEATGFQRRLASLGEVLRGMT